MRRSVWASVLAVFVMAFFCWRWMKVTSDLEYFLPDGGGAERVASQILQGLAQSPLSRRIVLLVSTAAPEDVVPATVALQTELEPLPITVLSRTEVGEPLIKAFFEHRYQLIALEPERELPPLLGPSGLPTRVEELKAALSSPAGALVRKAAVRDPLLLSRRPIERLQSLNNETLQMQGGILQTRDGRNGVIFAASEAPPFDSAAQTRLWEALQAATQRISARYPGVKVQASSLSRYAVAAEASMRRDTTRVSVISTAAIVALLIVAFGRVRHLPLMLAPLAAGFVAGTFACLALFGQIHAMTLAFGSALIGVCIDYPLHIVNHLALGKSHDGSARSLRVSLILGGVTTIVGLGAMVWGGLPGLRQIATFGGIGVLAALATALTWIPLGVRGGQATNQHRRAARLSGRVLAASLRHRKLAGVIVAVAVAVCAAGVPRTTWQDDPQKLTSVDPQMEVEDQRVRAATLGGEDNTFAYVVSNGDVEAGLRANETLSAALQRAQAAGAIGRFSSLADVVWSADLQQRNQTWVRENMREADVAAALAQAGFVASAFSPFGADGADLQLPPLRVQDLPALTQAVFVAPWSIDLADGRKAHLARVAQVRDSARLQTELATVANAGQLNVAAFRSAAYQTFRIRMLWLLSVGMAAIFVLLLFVYRSARAAVVAVAPAMVSAGSATGLLTLFGVSLNLMHLMGLLLVLSMGADYGIFMVARGRTAPAEPKDDGSLALGLLVACASTALSFGLLAISTAPALAAVGQMVGLGIMLVLVLAPALSAVLLPGHTEAA